MDAAKNESFSYDALGNRLTYNGVTSTYDQSGQRIQDDGQFTYVYDANGNIIYKSNKANGISYTFEYSALNQLKIAIVTSTPLNGNVLKTIEYKYDPVGRRILRNSYDHVSPQKSSTKKYYYDGDNIMAELDANNNIVVTYTHSPLRPDDVLGAQFTSFATPGGAASEGQVYAQNAGAVYYLKDHLNTVTDIINGSGQIVQRMDYSAFGVLRSVKDAAGNEVGFESAPVRTSFTYTGREYEPELGMYYYRARYYDPSTGRFLQQDPDPGKLSDPRTFLSKYIYTGNSPTNFTDSTGRDFWKDLLKAVVIVAAFASGAWVAGLAAGALGFAAGSAGAIITGTLIGAAVGGAVGAIAFPALGLGSSADGFLVGAAAGGLGGFAMGAGWLGTYNVSSYKPGKLISGIEDGINSFVKSYASPGSSNPTFAFARNTEFTHFLGVIEPYVFSIGGGAYTTSIVYNCSIDNCNIPTIPIFQTEFK